VTNGGISATNYWISVTDMLNAIRYPSDSTTRNKLHIYYYGSSTGYIVYTGTTIQNTNLLISIKIELKLTRGSVPLAWAFL
jgi:hypothetical protein